MGEDPHLMGYKINVWSGPVLKKKEEMVICVAVNCSYMHASWEPQDGDRERTFPRHIWWRAWGQAGEPDSATSPRKFTVLQAPTVLTVFG